MENNEPQDPSPHEAVTRPAYPSTWTNRHPRAFLHLAVAVSVVAIMLLSGLPTISSAAVAPSAPLASPSLPHPVATPTHAGIAPTMPSAGASPVNSAPLGAAYVQQASVSLANGAGPAAGTPLSCSLSTTMPGVTNCAPPALPVSPSTGSNPTINLGWSIQGVPSGRGYINYALTWDPVDQYVLLFGGSNSTGDYMGDTWEFQNGLWTELTPLTTPLGRDSSGLAYDPSDSSMMLFGGYTPATADALNDTWLFRGGVWSEVPTGNGPSPRYGFGLVYDPSTYSDILFGGYSPLCPTTSGGLCNDTWSWSYGSWTHLHTGGSPTPRYELSMTYDAINGTLVLFGGYGGSTCLQPSGVCGDTWTYGSGNWTQVATGGTRCGNNATGSCLASVAPGPRWEGAFAFDPNDGYDILFGGQNATAGTMGDTWEYSTGVWTHLAPIRSPYPRYGAGLTFDASPSDHFLFLAEGGYPYNTPPNIYWGYRAGNWTEVPPPANHPPSTYGASMAYDALDGYVVLFGGYSYALGYQNSTWIYRSGTWVHLSESTAPSPRLFASMAWDPQASALILFGGESYGTRQNDTWQFANGHWTEVCVGGTTACLPYGIFPPSARRGAALAYDAYDGEMVLFGGNTAAGYSNETWELYDGTWFNETSYVAGNGPVPDGRAFAGFVDDVRDSEDVLFGGSNGTGALGDTWVLTGLYYGWKEVGLCGGPAQPACSYPTPAPRSSFSMVYDSLDGLVLVTGGTTGPFGGGLLEGTFGFQDGSWYQCFAYTCNAYFGLAPLPLFPNSAYDPLDGYTILTGGVVASGETYGTDQYSWILGSFLTSAGPRASPEYIDVGQTTTFSVGAAGGGIGTYSYQWNGLPPGCTPPSPQATTFSCVVDRPAFTFYYNYTVGYGFYASPSVVVVPSNGFPEITSGQFYTLYVGRDTVATLTASTTSAEVGQTVTYTLRATNGWGPYQFALESAPPGCALTTPSYAVATYTCVLTSADLGVWSPVGSVTDSASYAAFSAPAGLTVSPAASASGVTVSSTAIDTGQALSIAVTPSGGLAPYSFVWTSVPGACLANSALLSCIVPSSEAGTYDPSVVVQDVTGATVGSTYSGSVVVSLPPTTSLTASPSALDAGQSLTLTVAVSGGPVGIDSFTWSGLPSGCPASDAIALSCHPTGAGPSEVTVVVTDANGGSSSSSTVVTVNPALGVGLTCLATGSTSPGNALCTASPSGGTEPYTFAWTVNGVAQTGAAGASLGLTNLASGSYSVGVSVTDGASSTAAATPASLSVASATSSSSSFATPFQLVELALLVVLLLLGVILLLRGRGGGSRAAPEDWTPPPAPVSTSPPTPPSGAAAGTGRPEYSED